MLVSIASAVIYDLNNILVSDLTWIAISVKIWHIITAVASNTEEFTPRDPAFLTFLLNKVAKIATYLVRFLDILKLKGAMRFVSRK